MIIGLLVLGGFVAFVLAGYYLDSCSNPIRPPTLHAIRLLNESDAWIQEGRRDANWVHPSGIGVHVGYLSTVTGLPGYLNRREKALVTKAYTEMVGRKQQAEYLAWLEKEASDAK